MEKKKLKRKKEQRTGRKSKQEMDFYHSFFFPFKFYFFPSQNNTKNVIIM